MLKCQAFNGIYENIFLLTQSKMILYRFKTTCQPVCCTKTTLASRNYSSIIKSEVDFLPLQLISFLPR